MNSIKEQLKEVIEEVMLPESKAYIEELHQLIKNNEATQDDKEAMEDMESFIVELENILLAISEDKISDDEATVVYDKINTMLEEHEED